MRARDAHPDYIEAKSGDAEAALRLTQAFITSAALTSIEQMLRGRRPYLIAVSAIEAAGFNAIPRAMARTIADELGLALVTGVVQANTVSHTRASGWHRLRFRAEFDGTIQPGVDYWIIDDHVGLGSTMAELRAFVHAQHGTIVGASTLTASRHSEIIALTNDTLSKLRVKHGQTLEDFWLEEFGYGLAGLTEPEAGYLLRAASVDAIRARLAETAGDEGRQGF
ncbi:MAG TPA: hypothetical protein VIM38_12065 [Alphaproteobacteria bacterium]